MRRRVGIGSERENTKNNPKNEHNNKNRKRQTEGGADGGENVRVSTLGGIEGALTLCLYGAAVNGDKGAASGAAQPDDVAAHVARQLGEAGGLQQEGLLGLHGRLGAAAVAHGNVVGLARGVTPRPRLLGRRGKQQWQSRFKVDPYSLTQAQPHNHILVN